jgi:O-antigen biosynthesis protein
MIAKTHSSAPGTTHRGELAVVVPVHGAFDIVEACLRAVIRTRRALDRIVVVDDGCSDTARLRRVVDSVTGHRAVIVRHNHRKGFSAAANTGVEAARSLGAASVLILNSDTIPMDGAIDRLESALYASPHVGAVGPLSNAAGRQSVPSKSRTIYDRISLRATSNSLSPAEFGRLVAQLASKPLDYVDAVDVTVVHGFAILLRLDAFDDVAGFDAYRFSSGHGAEVDLSLRLSARGWVLRVVTGSFIWHAGSASTGRAQRWVGVIRGRLQLNRRYGAGVVRRVRHETSIALRLPELRRQMSDLLELDSPVDVAVEPGSCRDRGAPRRICRMDAK